MTAASANSSTLIESLRGQLRGRLVTPDDADYDELRRLTEPIDARPPMIARVADTADVVTVVNFARQNGLELAVRSGGHGAAGLATTADGVVIDLREMRAVEIDSNARTAWVQAGATAAEVTSAAGERGLVLGFGDTGSVGVGGITLGGGIGYLSRKFGMTIDSLLHVELVTAAGEARRVDAKSDPDLFWALRGGGGNFGVATAFCYALQPLPQVVGGMLLLPATPRSIVDFIRLAEAAPDELTTIANVMNCPPMPFVPQAVVGTPVIMALICYAGGPDKAEPVLAPFRQISEPIADMLRPIAYAEMFPPEQHAEGDAQPAASSRTMFMREFGEPEASTLLERMAAVDAPMRGAQLRVLGGAIARVAADATAYAHRAAPIMANLFCFYTSAEQRPDREEWVTDLMAAFDQGERGAYVNFVGDEGEGRIHAAYPDATWARLREVKRRVDPDNVFHRNQNVAPAV